MLISNEKHTNDATKYLLFKYIHEILDSGEKLLNKRYNKDKNSAILRPNILIKVNKIDLRGKWTINQDYINEDRNEIRASL